MKLSKLKKYYKDLSPEFTQDVIVRRIHFVFLPAASYLQIDVPGELSQLGVIDGFFVGFVPESLINKSYFKWPRT